MSSSAPTREGMSLLTDLYQLTMAYGYWKSGLAERESVFHLFFRKAPFGGVYAVTAGLEDVIEHLSSLSFSEEDLEYLCSLNGEDGKPLISKDFADYLGALEFSVDIDAMPEGTVAFAHEPILRVRGPVLQCQLLETALLNCINFPTLVATKAARICDAARGEPVLEFGLRRAQGPDGALTASRAAYIGGCAATSNVLAGKRFGIPMRGTHAHSWVMLFEDEVEAFATYAAAMPGNCIFLVDTYDTLQGVKNAIEVGKALTAQGHKLAGIRLDSGDLAHLSREARYLLNRAGMNDVAISASNDLDEHVIDSLKAQGAEISLWGVGTKLVTAYDQPALGAVYKLSAVRGDSEQWIPKIKVSEHAAKTSTPGIQQVRRYYDGVECVGDAIFDVEIGRSDDEIVVDFDDPTRRRSVPEHTERRDLLKPIFKKGKLVYKQPALDDIKRWAKTELKTVSARSRRLLNPHTYLVGLDVGLHELRQELIAEARGEAPEEDEA